MALMEQKHEATNRHFAWLTNLQAELNVFAIMMRVKKS